MSWKCRILDLSNPQLKYGFLLLNRQPIEANHAYKDIYRIAKKSIYICNLIRENFDGKFGE